jgi:hypothetical protein
MSAFAPCFYTPISSCIPNAIAGKGYTFLLLLLHQCRNAAPDFESLYTL